MLQPHLAFDEPLVPPATVRAAGCTGAPIARAFCSRRDALHTTFYVALLVLVVALAVLSVPHRSSRDESGGQHLDHLELVVAPLARPRPHYRKTQFARPWSWQSIPPPPKVWQRALWPAAAAPKDFEDDEADEWAAELERAAVSSTDAAAAVNGLQSWGQGLGDSSAPTGRKTGGSAKVLQGSGDGWSYVVEGGPKRMAAQRAAAKGADTKQSAAQGAQQSLSQYRVRIEETGSAKGKNRRTTVIYGLEALPKASATALLKKLKAAVSVGGKVKENGELMLQGANADLVKVTLEKVGYKDIKFTGGAGMKNPLKPAWNAPKETKQAAEQAKLAAEAQKKAKAAAERAAKQSPQAIQSKMLAQLRKSESDAKAALKAAASSPATSDEDRLALEYKLSRIQQRLAEAERA